MKGICFIEPLFHNVVKGQKTQTRRMITPEPKIQNGWIVKPKSKYKVGEIVYLKEPYAMSFDTEDHPELSDNQQEYWECGYVYKFDGTPFYQIDGWKNKLFMPESAARYFIKITAIRVERLQDISDEDCYKEGVGKICFPALHYGIEDDKYFNWLGETPKDAYASLINKIGGKGTWDKNPYVWVYDFELLRK